MTPGWRRGGGDDRDNDAGDDGGRDADDSYFCVLRGGCGGAETTVAAAAGMCRTGELKCEGARRLRWWSRHGGLRKAAGCCPLHVEVSLGEMLNNKRCPRCVNGRYFLFCFQFLSVSVRVQTHTSLKPFERSKETIKAVLGKLLSFPAVVQPGSLSKQHFCPWCNVVC